MNRRVFLSAATLVLPALPALAQSGGGAAPRAIEGEPPGFRRPRRDRPLPDAAVARGTRNIAAAWLSDPTDRYRHFVLGSQHEAATLIVSTTDRRLFRLTLPEDSVFEDRNPRIADVDGDGQDEILVVRSYAKKGSALAIAQVQDPEGLVIALETPPIGEPNRWLNPAGVADFDGDGRPEVALVKTPHVGGELQLWRFEDDRKRLVLTTDDVSNHASGSRHQSLSAVADFDGDGTPELAIPSFDRREIRFLSFKGGRVRELHRAGLPARAGEDFRVVDQNGTPAVSVGIGAGRGFIVRL